MKRRDFLALSSLGAVEIVAGALEVNWFGQMISGPQPSTLTPQELLEKRIPGLISRLGAGAPSNAFAWTIDDAANADVLASYAARATTNNLRLTFFVNSSKSSWATEANQLKPLVEAGQVQLANHCHNHFDLTKLTDKEVRAEFLSCHKFLLDVYGTDARPFWRPPYRKLNQRVAKIAADLGYVTPTLWSNNLLNASPTTTADQATSRFETEAVSGAILLDHTNGFASNAAFERALAILASRNLKSVTLRDVFA